MIRCDENWNIYTGDLHIHTVYSDGQEEPWDMAMAAKELGYDFLAITDHDIFTEGIVDLNWRFRKEGIEMLSIRAEEVTMLGWSGEGVINDHIGHLLAYGIDKEIIQEVGDITALPILRRAEVLCDQIHAQGGYAIPAHPYWQPCVNNPDWREGFFHLDQKVLEGLLDNDKVDGIEVVNSGEPDNTEPADREYERRRSQGQRLAMTCGSDAHQIEEMGIATFYVFARELTEQAILEAIMAGRAVAFWDNRYFGDSEYVQLLKCACE